MIHLATLSVSSASLAVDDDCDRLRGCWRFRRCQPLLRSHFVHSRVARIVTTIATAVTPTRSNKGNANMKDRHDPRRASITFPSRVPTRVCEKTGGVCVCCIDESTKRPHESGRRRFPRLLMLSLRTLAQLSKLRRTAIGILEMRLAVLKALDAL